MNNNRSTTGQKYLNVDKGYKYVVRVVISGKHLVVWSGTNKAFGEIVAKKVEALMNKSKSAFLEWYDYDREQYLEHLKMQRRTA